MDLFASDRPGPARTGASAAEPGTAPPPARAPHVADDLHLGEWPPPSGPPSRRRWLLVAAVVPWVVVAVLVTRGAPAGPSPDPETTAPAAPGRQPTPAAADRPPPTAAATPTTAAVAVASTSAVTDRGRAVGLAVTVARSWLSTRPSALDLDGITPAPGADRRYVEHLAVESVDHPARGALVVTVRTVVLPIVEGQYGDPRVRRVAVPVRLTDTGPQLGGPPWWLATDDPAPAPPDTEPVDDPDMRLAAVDAVTAAGYAQVQLEELGRTDGWAWVAHVSARAPGRDRPADHTLWLRADVGRLVVAGTAHRPDRGSAPMPDAGGATPPPAAPSRREETP